VSTPSPTLTQTPDFPYPKRVVRRLEITNLKAPAFYKLKISDIVTMLNFKNYSTLTLSRKKRYRKEDSVESVFLLSYQKFFFESPRK
jgi:hypothetical protein